MARKFKPNGLQTWIGSLPINDHVQAVNLVAEHTPDIPVWIQLPANNGEGMITQFLPGLPGLIQVEDRAFIRLNDDSFNDDLVSFFEDYMNILDGKISLSGSRFALTSDTAPGFFEFEKYLDKRKDLPRAVKGQVTGPFTFATSVKDQDGRAIFYHDQARDVAAKSISMKARWQVNRLKKYGVPVIIFLDEPGLAGFGSSEFISVSKDDIQMCFDEVLTAIHAEGGVGGVHVCANTDWSLVLDSSADIVSFDAYSFFDKFILYENQIKNFIERGGILAWGIVPTGNIAWVDQENTESLYIRWLDQLKHIAALDIDEKKIIAQSLITPSCGTGSLPLDKAIKVVQMTKELSAKVREQFPENKL